MSRPGGSGSRSRLFRSRRRHFGSRSRQFRSRRRHSGSQRRHGRSRRRSFRSRRRRSRSRSRYRMGRRRHSGSQRRHCRSWRRSFSSRCRRSRSRSRHFGNRGRHLGSTPDWLERRRPVSCSCFDRSGRRIGLMNGGCRKFLRCASRRASLGPVSAQHGRPGRGTKSGFRLLFRSTRAGRFRLPARDAGLPCPRRGGPQAAIKSRSAPPAPPAPPRRRCGCARRRCAIPKSRPG